jgi:thiamine monophosphate synthase
MMLFTYASKSRSTRQVNAALNSAQSIYNTVRNKLTAHIKTLEFRYKVKPDEKMKAEIEKLKFDLEGLPEQWEFLLR